MRGKGKANKTPSIKERLVEQRLSARESVICFNNKENKLYIFYTTFQSICI